MPPKITRRLPPIPPAFAAKKATILASLAVPSSEYKDVSPKGSVDDGIIPLIEKINTLDGVVTTSSCAGRVSVFLEGRKSKHIPDDEQGVDGDGGLYSSGEQVVVGGKGNGGRWLFVSHEPVDLGRIVNAGESLTGFLGIAGEGLQNDEGFVDSARNSGMRLVRFQFEPMILHIMTASLTHASSILTAGINAGFRESGVQSLKNLDDPSNAFPMVAIRSSGLALESVIGYVEEYDAHYEAKESIHRLVGEDHLALLLRVANERFCANEQRKKRFADNLFRSAESQSTEWETRESRQARQKAEGLARQHALRDAVEGHTDNPTDESSDHIGLLE